MRRRRRRRSSSSSSRSRGKRSRSRSRGMRWRGQERVMCVCPCVSVILASWQDLAAVSAVISQRVNHLRNWRIVIKSILWRHQRRHHQRAQPRKVTCRCYHLYSLFWVQLYLENNIEKPKFTILTINYLLCENNQPLQVIPETKTVLKMLVEWVVELGIRN